MEAIAQHTFATQGHCNPGTSVQNFDAEAYMGVWYGQQHTKDVIFVSNDFVCGQTHYYDLSADGFFVVQNSWQEPTFTPRDSV